MSNDFKVKEIDDWLDPELTSYLSDVFLNRLPHYFVERSRKEGSKMYSHDFHPSDVMIGFICEKIRKLFDYDINFSRIYFNIQHPTMEGMWHVDSKLIKDAGHTVMLMMTPDDEDGAFFYRPDPENDQYQRKIHYKQNKLLIFPAEMEHYGSTFKTKPRITLVFKTLKANIQDEPNGPFYEE